MKPPSRWQEMPDVFNVSVSGTFLDNSLDSPTPEEKELELALAKAKPGEVIMTDLPLKKLMKPRKTTVRMNLTIPPELRAMIEGYAAGKADINNDNFKQEGMMIFTWGINIINALNQLVCGWRGHPYLKRHKQGRKFCNGCGAELW